MDRIDRTAGVWCGVAGGEGEMGRANERSRKTRLFAFLAPEMIPDRVRVVAENSEKRSQANPQAESDAVADNNALQATLRRRDSVVIGRGTECDVVIRDAKASEMYLRKMRPRQTCLYSEASMWPRILSAAAQSWASKPRAAPFLELELDADFDFAAIFKSIAQLLEPVLKAARPDLAARRDGWLGRSSVTDFAEYASSSRLAIHQAALAIAIRSIFKTL